MSRVRKTVAVTAASASLLFLAGYTGVVMSKTHGPSESCPFVLHLQDRESGMRSEVCVDEQTYRDTPIGTQWGGGVR